MERISFKYESDWNHEHSDEKREIVFKCNDHDGGGIRCDEVCELFQQFMLSVGYSWESIQDYFR